MHIQEVPRAGGWTKYRARWIDEGGVERSRTFEHRYEAQGFLDAMVIGLEPDEITSIWIRPGWYVAVCPICGAHIARDSVQARADQVAIHETATGHEMLKARGKQ